MFTEIADQAGVLQRLLPNNVKRYFRDVETMPSHAMKWANNCDEHIASLDTLLKLVYAHLPDVPTKLEVVRISGVCWHDKSTHWDDFVTDLRLIEDAAMTAAMTAGNNSIPLEFQIHLSYSEAGERLNYSSCKRLFSNGLK